MGLMLQYKKFPDKYFDWDIHEEFPQSEINKHRWWYKEEYDNNGNVIYYENSFGNWTKWECDEDGRVIYQENSDGSWKKFEYDTASNVIYYENSDGEIRDNRR